jgi:exopolyphosphatase / guanosine-5'-triphosphate,3'-diphosphate pyrophosphatase
VNSRFASVDIGSHTVRLLIAEMKQPSTVVPIRLDRRITRLAKGFPDGETLKQESIDETLEVLQQFATIIHSCGVRSVNCGATGVVRRARNADEFLRRVESSTGILPSILSEELEAFLSAKGILRGLPKAERFVLSFDLGGSSTELLLTDTFLGESLWSTSVFIGAATITERCLRGDPPERASMVVTSEAIRTVLHPSLLQVSSLLDKLEVHPRALQLVGTAGTVTTLAAMFLKMNVYEPSRVNGLILTEAWLTPFIETLSLMPQTERLGLAGLEKGRGAIVLGGALIVRELMYGLRQPFLTVVDSGLLEGLLLNLIEKEKGHPPGLLSPYAFRLQEARERNPLN